MAFVGLSLAIVLSGCSVRKDYYAIDGSRADGTVDLAYDFKPFETAVTSLEQADSVATTKCRSWGYSSAELFGGSTQNCYSRNGFGECIAGQYIVKFQCLGNLDSPQGQAPSITSNTSPVGAQSKSEWQEKQLQMLKNEQGLSYEEYMKRYRTIMSE